MSSLLHVTKQLYVPIATMFNLFEASNEYTEYSVNIYFMLK